MTIGIFHPFRNVAQLNDNVIRTVIEGFRNNESDVFVSPVKEYVKCDVAVRWGIFSKKARRTAYRKEIDEKHNGPIVVIELGWLGDRTQHFQFGFGGLSGRAQYYYPPEAVAKQRFNRVGIMPAAQRRKYPDDYILICGQVPWDTAVQHIDYLKWVYNTIDEVKEKTHRTIVFRPHPKAPTAVDRSVINSKGVRLSVGSLEKDLKSARCVIAYNSNSALESLVRGVPTITMDPGSMVHDLTQHTLDGLEHPIFPDSQLLYNRLVQIANSQWTFDELKDNLPWQIAKQQLGLK